MYLLFGEEVKDENQLKKFENFRQLDVLLIVP
jgi:hypothetical protein